MRRVLILLFTVGLLGGTPAAGAGPLQSVITEVLLTVPPGQDRAIVSLPVAIPPGATRLVGWKHRVVYPTHLASYTTIETVIRHRGKIDTTELFNASWDNDPAPVMAPAGRGWAVDAVDDPWLWLFCWGPPGAQCLPVVLLHFE
jgi:hypothetical protein